MERPRTIVAFELLMIGALLLGWLQFLLTWDEQLRRLQGGRATPTTVLIIVGAVSAIMLLLTVLVSRRRSRVAVGILIVLFALGLPGFVRTVSHGLAIGYTPLAILQIVGQLVAYVLLFLPASRRWFRRQDNAIDLRETFS